MKKYLLSFLTIALAVVGSAFTVSTPASKPAQECQWFLYTAGDYPTTVTQARTPANYEALPGEPAVCDDDARLCAICAQPDPVDGTRPLINTGSSVSNAINAYFGSQTDSDLIAEKQE